MSFFPFFRPTIHLISRKTLKNFTQTYDNIFTYTLELHIYVYVIIYLYVYLMIVLLKLFWSRSGSDFNVNLIYLYLFLKKKRIYLHDSLVLKLDKIKRNVRFLFFIWNEFNYLNKEKRKITHYLKYIIYFYILFCKK